jgi:hypothetical protein
MVKIAANSGMDAHSEVRAIPFNSRLPMMRRDGWTGKKCLSVGSAGMRTTPPSTGLVETTPAIG